MGVKNCVRCGALLDSKAKTCDVCGKPQRINRFYYLLIAVIILPLTAGLFLSDNQTDQSSVVNDNSNEHADTELLQEYYITANELNVRLAPSIKAKITNVVYQGALVQVYEVLGEWARTSEYYDVDIEGIDGKVARWVSTRYLSTKKPAEEKWLSSSRLEAALSSSDDHLIFKGQFIKVSKELIDSGVCTIDDLESVGGWVRSVNYKPRRVYFTYCGRVNLSGKIYYEPATEKVFR